MVVLNHGKFPRNMDDGPREKSIEKSLDAADTECPRHHCDRKFCACHPAENPSSADRQVHKSLRKQGVAPFPIGTARALNWEAPYAHKEKPMMDSNNVL